MQGQCEASAESTSLLDGYAEAKPALGEAKAITYWYFTPCRFASFL